MSPANQNEGVYRSGVAARLSGIPVDTLRIWERRYSIIGPRLSAGRQRLYSAADIRRLATIKQLVDLGHPIGTIASLDTDALLGIQAATWSSQNTGSGKTSPETHGEISVALVGPLVVSEQFCKALSGDAIRVAARCADPDRAVADLKDVSAQIAIIELPTLRDVDLGRVAAIKTACNAVTAIVLYRFAPSTIVRRMRMAGHAVARSMSDAAELEAICVDLMRRPRLDAGDALRLLASAEPRPARFDEPTLARLSGASRTIECECPRHLVDLVMSLGGFENYSAECATRSPSDAVLHLDLQRAAGLARSIMEQALERLAIAEGIPFSATAPSP
jgi:DNA-binding transcriptional MerR regulator